MSKNKFIGIFCLIFGLIALFMSVGSVIDVNAHDYVKTTGVISDVKRWNVNESRYVYVDFVVDGVQYNHISYDLYDINYKVGDEVTLWYDKDNPSHITAQKGRVISVFNIILTVVGAIISVVGIVFVLKPIRKLDIER